jgi:hypothetical protein
MPIKTIVAAAVPDYIDAQITERARLQDRSKSAVIRRLIEFALKSGK